MFEKLLPVLERLTLGRVLLWVLAGFSAIALHWVWEQRDAVFITMTGSPFSLLTIAAIVIVVVTAWVAAMFIGLSEKRTDGILKQMSARVTDAEVRATRQDAEIARLHQVIVRAVDDERNICEARLQQIIAVMSSHGIKDRRLNSRLGDLG